jgi:hypothetical protein
VAIVLQVFGNKMTWKMLGPERVEGNYQFRIIHSEEACDLFRSPSVVWIVSSRTLEWAEHVARTGEMRMTCRILVRINLGKSPLGNQEEAAMY